MAHFKVTASEPEFIQATRIADGGIIEIDLAHVDVIEHAVGEGFDGSKFTIVLMKSDLETIKHGLFS